MKDLKYLMSYSIAFMAFLGISIGGVYNYLAVLYTFIFIPIIEIIVNKSNEKFSDEEKRNRLLDPFFDILLYLNIPIVFFPNPNCFAVIDNLSIPNLLESS